MKLIVGLGNPGIRYGLTRHNAGSLVVKALARDEGAGLKSDRGTSALSAKAKIGQAQALLAVPLTFMNLSGAAVAALMKKHRVELNDLLVACDDLDLELGRIKLKPQGTSGGHKGLDSIIKALGSNGFCRLRVGIGRPPHQLGENRSHPANWCGGRPLHKALDVREYVLAPFSRKDKAAFQEAIETAADCCRAWVNQGTSEAMNIFNGRNK